MHGAAPNMGMSDIDGIRRVAVLGLGTMGHGIAQTFALAGYKVNCFDELASMRDSLAERVNANLAAFVAADVLAPEQVNPALARLQPFGTEIEAVARAQFVTEAVPEDLEIKQKLFERLERIVLPQTILASNSSSFPISQSGSLMVRP